MIAAKKRCLRTRRASDSSDSEGANAEDHVEVSSVRNSVVVVEAIRELQKVRKRPAGISLSALSTGKVAPEELAIVSDPFKLKTGGLVVMRHVTDPKSNEDEDDVEARLAKTFATETNKRDEDAEMIKYIEEEVARRKGLRKSPSPEPAEGSDLLQDVPEYLRPAIGQQKEDMLSNQMLCGIPEIDLGVEAKMRNIEATEDAKQTLLKQRFTRRHGFPLDGLAPANVAVNFVQHSRWHNHSNVAHPSDADYKRDLSSISTKKEPLKPEPCNSEQVHLEKERERLRAERATDSIALQRFRSYMRDRRRR
ncbi:uncharacterized protein DEA37_0003023 [Paragonimus westermani]|uniref:Hepatocellular carcinoma-associated antigen 59 n=1 Tax=Paragonimus westermani TaxID=34504 RepID=A0A5J4NFY5_9TREM|nr:uncharacterized protein DEA37_0003023 [Paragonimus westermani]